MTADKKDYVIREHKKILDIVKASGTCSVAFRIH